MNELPESRPNPSQNKTLTVILSSSAPLPVTCVTSTLLELLRTMLDLLHLKMVFSESEVVTRRVGGGGEVRG